MKHRQSNLNNFLHLCFLIVFLGSCGPDVKQYVTRDNSYSFYGNNKTIYLSMKNIDGWILQGNEILEKELYLIAQSLLKQGGFTLTDTKDNSRYLLSLTIGSEIGQEPVDSYTTIETQVDIYGGGGLKQTPKTHVTGGGSYRAVIVSCSCFDLVAGRQVFFAKTSTTMLNLDRLMGYTREDMYKTPIKIIIQDFLKNVEEHSK